jgi:hypothetical protein
MLISYRPLTLRFLVPILGLLVFAFFAAIYITHPTIYFRLVKVLIDVPAPHAFVDWEYVPSAIRCWSEGVDVYTDNTCFKVWGDPQPFPYSPFLLRARFLKYDENWIGTTMLAACVLFFLSIATLPSPRNWRELVITLFALLSCATFLLMERGNLDLILFLMIVAGIQLRRSSLAFRLGGYGLIVLAGLIKFYPFMALIMVLRERLIVLVVVSIASAAALASLLFYQHELALMAANLPAPSYFLLQFGAADLPAGIGILIGRAMGRLLHADSATTHAAAELIMRVLLPSLMVAAIAVAITVARRCQLPPLLQTTLPIRHTDFLLAGAAVICGCFFAGQSVIYRGIYLLLVLPGLAELAWQQSTTLRRRLFASACAAIAFVLWAPFLDQFLKIAGLTPRLSYIGLARQTMLRKHYSNYDNFPGWLGYILWLASEVAWWWIITLLLAVLGSFIARTELWRLFRRSLGIGPSRETSEISPSGTRQ